MTKSKFDRVISVFLALVLLLGMVNCNAFTVNAEEVYSNTLNEWTVNSWWTMRDGSTDTLEKADYSTNSDSVEVKLNISYSVKKAQKEYAPGEFSFSFEGIGGIDRTGTLIGNTVGLDSMGNSTNTDKNWEVTYDRETDTYTYVNKITIGQDTSQHGGFDIVWSFPSRQGVNGYETEIDPIFTIIDKDSAEQTLNMFPMTYKYNSVEDDFKLTVDLYPDNDGKVDGTFYETADKSFVWYQYRTQLWQGNENLENYDELKARGLYKSDLFMEIDVKDIIENYIIENHGIDMDDPNFNINDYVRVVDSSNHSVAVVKTNIDGEDRWGYYIHEDKYGDYPHHKDYYYKIAYNQDVFNGEKVVVKAILNRLYNDESDYRLLRDDANNYYADSEPVDVTAYQLNYGGYGSGQTKYSAYEESYHQAPKESKKLVVNRIYNGGIVEYKINTYAQKKYSSTTSRAVKRSAPAMKSTGLTEDTAYSLVIGDDELEVYLNSGEKRRLTEGEYNFSHLRMPEVAGKYDYQIYTSYKQDPKWDEYTLLAEGNTGNAQYFAFGEDVKAFYVRINGITGSYGYEPVAGVSFHLDYDAEMEKDESDRVKSDGHIVNYSFRRMLYNYNGEEVDYCGGTSDGSNNLNRDLEPENYGCYLSRTYSNVWLRVPKVTLGSRTYWDAEPNVVTLKTGYTIDVDTYGSIVNTDNIEGELKQFAVYSILPPEFKVTQEMLEESFTLQATGTDRNGLPLKYDDFENHVKKQELITLDDGRTALCVTFDFSDRPLEISKLTWIHINYTASISGKVLDASSHNFTVDSRTAILDDGFIVMASSNDTNRSLVKDVDNLSGDTSRDMAGSYFKSYLSSIASAWNNAAEKQVKAGNTIDYTRDREIDYLDEAEVSAYNADNFSEDMIYTYELGVTLRNIKTNDFVIYDNIETYESAKDGITTSWHGTPLELDTTKIENKNFVPYVFYSVNESQKKDLKADGWIQVTEYNNGKWTIPEDARSIAVKLGTEKLSGGYYQAPQEQSDQLYVYLKMRSPSPTKESIDKKAYNTCSAEYLQTEEDEYTEIKGSYTSVTLTTKFFIEKVDADDHDIKLSGAKFEIYENDKKNLVDTVTTNRFGKAEVHGLIFGEEYYYKEVGSPKGYERNCEGTFTVDKGNQKLIVENKKLKGAVTLTKYDEDNNDIKIKAGAEYQLFAADGTQIYTDDSYNVSENGTVGTFVTDENSTITITGLSWGVYYFVETKAPQGYELDSTTETYFTIDKSLDNEEIELDALWANCAHGDKEKTASLLLKKTDKTDGKPLKYAYYQLQRLDSDGNWQTLPSSYFTNAVGEIKVDGVGFGTYRFKEYNPPAGYELKDESELTESDEITINADIFSGDGEVVLKTAQTNERKTGSVMLSKEDKDTGNALSGAIFALYKVDKDGDKFIKGGFTTDSYGRLVADTSKDENDIDRFKIQGLEWGDYYFLETKSPKGYEKPTEDYCKDNFNFTVSAATVDSTPTVKAKNTQVKGSVKLTKIAEKDKTKYLADAEFELLNGGNPVDVKQVHMGEQSFYYYDSGDSLAEIKSFVKSTFGYNDDLVISNPNRLLVSDALGVIEVYNLPWGTYEFHETKAPNGYSKADNVRFVVNSSNCLFQQELECADPDLTCEITIDKVINDCIEDYGNSTFLFNVKQIKDNGGNDSPDDMEWTVYITLQYPEKSGSVTLNVPAGEYMITEMPVSRYKPVKIETVEKGTTTTVYTPKPSSDSDFTATCTLGTDDEGNPQKFEVEYTNKLTRYDQFSHVTCTENYIAKQKQLTGLSLEYTELIPVDPNADENTVYVLDKSKLIGNFIYDDGSSEQLTPEQIESIVTDSGKNDFEINNSLENQGQDFMLRAKYTDPDTGRTFNTAFVVTVDAFDPAAYRKITFTANADNAEYIGKVGTAANVVFYDENNKVVLGEYKDAASNDGFDFNGWIVADGSGEKLDPDDIDYYSLPEGTVLQAQFVKVFKYDYKNTAQEFTVPANGYYVVELWGASGGPSSAKAGRGGYTKGTVYLTKETKLYIYTGEASTNGAGGFNGGGAGADKGYGGGGATDIRLVDGSWNNFDSLKSRIMVAGGGGGANAYSTGSYGGYAGGLIGDYGHIRSDSNTDKLEAAGLSTAYGGTQTGGGKSIQLPNTGKTPGKAGALGKGGDAYSFGGGGGAGYYGGAGGCNRPCGSDTHEINGCAYGNSESAGAGGSSFISGYEGCDAIDESSTSGKIVHTRQPNHYSGYVFKNSEMIDGGSEMLSPTGKTEIGHMGNGYARITFIGTKLR